MSQPAKKFQISPVEIGLIFAIPLILFAWVRAGVTHIEVGEQVVAERWAQRLTLADNDIQREQLRFLERRIAQCSVNDGRRHSQDKAEWLALIEKREVQCAQQPVQDLLLIGDAVQARALLQKLDLPQA